MSALSCSLFTFQQDGAPAHLARETVQLLREQMPDSMGWQPNSHDLNSVDYGIWGLLQESVCHKPIRGVQELKQ